jgi:hypothetical protein
MEESSGTQPGGLGGNPVGGDVSSTANWHWRSVFLIFAFRTVGVDRLGNWASSARTRLDVGSMRLGCDSASVLCTLCAWTAHQESL